MNTKKLWPEKLRPEKLGSYGLALKFSEYKKSAIISFQISNEKKDNKLTAFN